MSLWGANKVALLVAALGTVAAIQQCQRSVLRAPEARRAVHASAVAMGISGLSQVLADNAPASIRENEIKNYFGRIVAIDASMSIYQFLIAVRSDGQNLTNDAGETTSHLMGMFYRTIRMVDRSAP